MAAVVDAPALFRVHAQGGTAVPDVGGWDHAPFRDALREARKRAECDEDRWVVCMCTKRRVVGWR